MKPLDGIIAEFGEDWTVDPKPGEIPVRFWTAPNTCVLGYMSVGEPTTEGDTESFQVAFRGAPLTEPPRYDIRIYPEEHR